MSTPTPENQPGTPDEFDMIAVRLGSDMLHRDLTDPTRGRAFGDFLLNRGYSSQDLIDMCSFDDEYTVDERKDR
jgi:hypothetical protein